MIEFICVFAICYLWHMLGTTIGYHRLLSHRSFTCPKLVEYFFVFGGYLALEGSPIWWAAIHRAHHRYVDTPLDPHSPRNGYSEAHSQWMMRSGYPSHIDPGLQCKDLVSDPIYRFLELGGHWKKAFALAVVLSITLRLLILLCFGWVAALASLAAAYAVLQVPLLLNVVCHIPKLGYKTYATADDSVNVWWVGLLAMGEGWHNNHHAFPGSARSGFKMHELDVSWLVLRLLKSFGLIGRLNEPARSETLAVGMKNRQLAAIPVAAGDDRASQLSGPA